MQKKEIFPVTGLGCAACATRVGKVLNAQSGVIEANVNYASATALVEYDSEKCSPESLQKAVEEAGYGLITDVQNEEEEAAETERLKQYRALKRQTIGAVICALPVFVLSMFFMDLRWGQWVTFVLSTVALSVFGRRFFINAWRQLRHGAVNMDTLVAKSVFPRVLAFPWRRAASVFRGGQRHSGLYPHRPSVGSQGKAEDIRSHPGPHGTPAQDGDSGLS